MTKLYEYISGQYETDTGGNAITLSGLYEFIKPRFIFKGSNDCCTFYLDDKTDYTEVADISGGTVQITSALYYRSCCGLVCLCPADAVTQGGRKEYKNKYGDGEFVVIITMSYTYDDIGNQVTVSDQWELDIELDCCKALREDILCTAQTKMTGILCEVNTRRKVGRDYCELMWSLYKLSNVRWLMLRSCIDCVDTQIFKCYIDKIKSYNCGVC